MSTTPEPRCPICDRPMGNEQTDYEPKPRARCYFFYLRRHGLTQQGAQSECGEHRVDWRARALKVEAELRAVRAQLKTAQHALTRHHQKLYTESGMFRDNARIE